jgi:hypothetical protein
MRKAWSMKSKSIWKVLVPSGTGEVVKPRGVTYRVTCQEWFSQGDLVSRILPTIWVQSCSVAQVSRHAAVGNSGHGACEMLLMPGPHACGS